MTSSLNMLLLPELTTNVLLHLDADHLKEIIFLNKQINSILNSKQFWINKYECEGLPVLENLSLQEYIKLLYFRKLSKTMLVASATEKCYITIELEDNKF